MIFYFNADGSQLALTPEKVYQGSNRASTVYFVCPTAKTNLVSLAFTLPDGSSTEIYPMTMQENFSIPISETDNLYCFTYLLPSSVTAMYGNVNVQFFISSIGGEVTTTASSSFFVEKGVPVVEPEKGDSYLQLLNKILEIQNNFKEEIVCDEELSSESTNPVQNKVVTEALNGKVDLFEPPYKGTTWLYCASKNSLGQLNRGPKEVLGTPRADAIPLMGNGGALPCGTPSVNIHAVNLEYFNANIGHRYKFTAEASNVIPSGEGGKIIFYHDTKSQFDLSVISQELLNQNVVFAGHIKPSEMLSIAEGCFIGTLIVETIVVGEENSMTITSEHGVCNYIDKTQAYPLKIFGTLTFTVEQVY